MALDPYAESSRIDYTLATDIDAHDTVLEIHKLLADDSQRAGSNVDFCTTNKPLTPRSALVKRKYLRNPAAELSKKVSFGSGSTRSSIHNSPQELEPANASCQQPSPREHEPTTASYEQPTKQHLRKQSFSQTGGKQMAHVDDGTSCNLPHTPGSKNSDYAMFRTRSVKLEKQLSRVRSNQEHKHESTDSTDALRDSEGSMSVGRYFDALKGPELEILKDYEESILPLDKKWPFLLRFPIGCFGSCLGLGAQAVLWKTLATAPSMSFLRVPQWVNIALWFLAIVVLVIVFTTYTLKCVLYFEAVRREFHHPVRVNYFFAPWIALMFLASSIPPSFTTSIHPALWCISMTPLLILELKIYGQWLSGGQRRLSKVANASTHLSLTGNFVSALLAAKIGWREPAVFFWAVGCAHYLVLFVTLYQRLPTAEALPKELHPVFSMFIAVPSTASVAWKYISGDFDRVSRMAYFVALFLYSSLAVRLKLFCGFKFSVAWWAYTFPMTSSAIATIHYSMEVRHPFTQVLAVTLSVIATLTVAVVFISTIFHSLSGSLFPNDIAIAITNRRPGKLKRLKRTSKEGSSTSPGSSSKVHCISSSGWPCNSDNLAPNVEASSIIETRKR